MAAVKRFLVLGWQWMAWQYWKAARKADRLAWRLGLKSRWPLVLGLLGVLVLGGGLVCVAVGWNKA